jgi:hypothetical protein
MALTVYIFASLIMVFGMLFGWAWGAAAMAAGLRARSAVVSAAQVERAQST